MTLVHAFKLCTYHLRIYLRMDAGVAKVNSPTLAIRALPIAFLARILSESNAFKGTLQRNRLCHTFLRFTVFA
jgi:hypothetical protein